MSRAVSASASSETVWSMPPVGAPATSDSARMHAAARSRRASGVVSIPSRSATATATEHSSAAELDRPAPSGTVPSTKTSTPGTSWPASRSAHSTPATYAAQPEAEARSSRPPSHGSGSWRLAIRTRPSPRGATAAYVAWGSASGRHRPAL